MLKTGRMREPEKSTGKITMKYYRKTGQDFFRKDQHNYEAM